VLKVASADSGQTTWQPVRVMALGAHTTEADGRAVDQVMLLDSGDGHPVEGGAAVDAEGRVVAVTTTGSNGDLIGIPIDLASAAARSMMTKGRFVISWIGVGGDNLSGEAAHDLGISGGALVRSVEPGTPADKVGLTPGDVIVAVDAKQVTTMVALVLALRHYDVGDPVSLTYYRAGQKSTVVVVLTERHG
jgi:S1-C subfamily serine protease